MSTTFAVIEELSSTTWFERNLTLEELASCIEGYVETDYFQEATITVGAESSMSDMIYPMYRVFRTDISDIVASISLGAIRVNALHHDPDGKVEEMLTKAIDAWTEKSGRLLARHEFKDGEPVEDPDEDPDETEADD